MDDISKRLQSALRARKMSQSDLARALHVERASVNVWVKGKYENVKDLVR